MIAVVKKVSTFLSKSNKKLITLKEAMRISGCDFRRLKGLCETRWVERITALENFAIFYVAIVRALMSLSLWKDRDTQSTSKALLSAVTSSTFIVALFSCVEITDTFDTLSKNLQTVNKSLNEAMNDVNVTIETLKDHREFCTERFQKVFK